MGFMNAAKNFGGLTSKYLQRAFESAKGITNSVGNFLNEHGEQLGNSLGIAGQLIAPIAFPVAAKAFNTVANVLPDNKITSTLKKISDGTTFKNLHDSPSSQYKSSESRTVPGEGIIYGQSTAPRQILYRTDSLYNARKQIENSQPQNRLFSSPVASEKPKKTSAAREQKAKTRKKIRVKRRVKKAKLNKSKSKAKK